MATVWVGRGRQDGSADPTFGNDGSGRVSIYSCAANAPVRILSDLDGAVIVWSGACLLRLLASGTLDEDFGSLAAVPANFVATGLARDDEGRWVLAGSAGNEWKVLRFLHEGTPDGDFGSDGSATITLPSDSTQQGVNALTVRGDGRIVLAGWRSHVQSTDLLVIQLDATGYPDEEWNGTGTIDLEPPPGQFAIVATAAVLDRDGHLVIGGHTDSPDQGSGLLITSFDESGSLVDGFGLRVFYFDDLALNGFFESRDSVALSNDGHILLGTTAVPPPGPGDLHVSQFVLVRAMKDGTLDEEFGETGWRAYAVDDPTNLGQSGSYQELHATAYSNGAMLMFGRTFFEDQSNGRDYVSIVRARFDALFVDGFER